MHFLSFNVGALALAIIFYSWRAYQGTLVRHRTLRQRVAFMLWIMVHRPEESAPEYYVDDFDALDRSEAMLRC